MRAKLALLMITKNSEELLKKSLSSVKEIVNEMIVIDGSSTDNTKKIAHSFGASVFIFDSEDLGKKREYGLKKVKSEWILALDADEIVSKGLKNEIAALFHGSIADDAFIIPFQNHFLGRPLYYGGENYKMLRLFKKDSVEIKPALVHEEFALKKGRVGKFNSKINHFSYRSLPQMFSKFTDYAVREARQKARNGEKTTFKKIFLYPIHMFYARFIGDRGYKDGLFRIPLDMGFAYMEFLTYFSMLFIKK